MVVMEWEYPILPPIQPAKKSLFQRLRDIYNRRKKKTLKGKRRWFEIFRRKNRNASEANASLQERVDNDSSYQDVPNTGQIEENQRDDGPDNEKPAQKKAIKSHVTTSGIGFKSGKSKSRWSPPDSEETASSRVSKPPNGSSEARVTGKPPVAPCESSKNVRRSRVPDTNMVASDDEDENRALEEKTQEVQEPKELSELEKRAMEVDALIMEVENMDVSSVRPRKISREPQEINREPPEVNREPQQQRAKSPDVLDGLDELLDDVENGPVSRVCKPRRPKYESYMDEVLEGMDDLMDDVYYDW